MAENLRAQYSFTSFTGQEPPTKTTETLDNEFRYYSKLIEELIGTLTRKEDQDLISIWMRKLTSEGYNIVHLRDKRNRYMLMICMSLTMGSIRGPFTLEPPSGILSDPTRLEKPLFTQYNWELDKMWEDEVQAIKEIENMNEVSKVKISLCPIHNKACPPNQYADKTIGICLDKQFKYFLYLAKPYAALLLCSSDRLRASKWIQTLCRIEKTYCAVSKGIRNDYMMVLLGYLLNQQMIGPFQQYPVDKLLPLIEYTKLTTEKPITDPTHPRTAEFFRSVPHPEEGAFAMIALTGDLYEPKY